MDPLLLAYVALGVAALSLVTALIALISLRQARRQLGRLKSSTGEVDLLEFGNSQSEGLEETRRAVARVAQQLNEVQAEVATSLRHLAVVRFNALSDMGGRFSFALALLDDSATGVVLTSIQGHQQGRMYAKPVFEGECDSPLSPEEVEAIKSARPREN